MPTDQYLDNPALKPTILVSALKPVQRAAPARRAEPADERVTRESPRAA